MSCCSGKTSDKFVITKGIDNTFVFTIKRNNSTLPMTISLGDTFRATLRTLGTDVQVLSKFMNVVDAENGRVELVITAAETADMEKERGPKEDRFYARPTHTLLLICSTEVNGDFVAKVANVYVD